ncbi:MAG: DUF547 domain-containing protein, partial [Pseudomonadota bacterium]
MTKQGWIMMQQTKHVSRRTVVAGALAAASLAVAPLPAMANVTEAFAKSAPAEAGQTVDHSAWTKLLQTYVEAGSDGLNRVDYAGFKKDGHAALKSYVAKLEGTDPTKLSRPEQFAYWANLYNAKTIDVVLDAFPVKSIREIQIGGGLLGFLKKSAGAGGPWKAEIMTVNGRKLSLDNVEHDIMRKVFNDPRVHYSVNCASIGCPNLRREAFTGAKLEEQLDAGARAFVNSPRGFRVENGQLIASSIYSWFQVDFGGSKQGVLDHARKYADEKTKAMLSDHSDIASFKYDWALNDTK